eukprot:1982884-Alexandrium_andersonii.AAC.1
MCARIASSAAALERRLGGCGHARWRSVCSIGKGRRGSSTPGVGASWGPLDGRPTGAEPVALRRSFHAA